MVVDYTLIGRRIKYARMKNKITQEEMADKLDVSAAFYSRVERGTINVNTPYVLCRQDGTQENVKFSKMYQFEGLKRVACDSAEFGDLVSVAGIADLNIGETACDPEHIEPLPFVKIDEPTIRFSRRRLHRLYFQRRLGP